jgi:transketolase N-terminal domain/subunit
MHDIEKLINLAKLVRYFIISSTTTAGSGHPTSSLSATDLMTALLFGGFFRTRHWKDYDIHHELTDKGIDKFSSDWNALIQ